MDIRDIARLARVLSQKNRLLTLQQIIWINQYLSNNFWPLTPWTDYDYVIQVMTATLNTCNKFVAMTYGPDLVTAPPLSTWTRD